MEVKVYQANIEWKNKFMSYDFIQTHGGLDEDEYKCVFEGNLPDCHNLEDVFYVLNMRHPEGYKGHSLSTSDIIVVKGLGTYFVDFIGFQEIFNFKGEN